MLSTILVFHMNIVVCFFPCGNRNGDLKKKFQLFVFLFLENPTGVNEPQRVADEAEWNKGNERVASESRNMEYNANRSAELMNTCKPRSRVVRRDRDGDASRLDSEEETRVCVSISHSREKEIVARCGCLSMPHYLLFCSAGFDQPPQPRGCTQPIVTSTLRCPSSPFAGVGAGPGIVGVCSDAGGELVRAPGSWNTDTPGRTTRWGGGGGGATSRSSYIFMPRSTLLYACNSPVATIPINL